MPELPQVSPRRKVEQLAAHLAHLLNTGDEVVALNLFVLHQTVIRTLGSATYASVVGARLAGPERRPEEIAQKYLDTTLDRRLMLARANHTHKGHELLLALCRRGLDARWWQADLVRRTDVVAATETVPPSDFGSVAARLGKVDKGISAGNPAASTRERFGLLNLAVGGAHAEVAEELSVWKGITCAPLKLSKLDKGAPFDSFCSLVIKAVEAANAPFGAFLAVGLSPYDWAEELSTNTLKKLGTFLATVRAELGDGISGRGDIETWRRVWHRRPVPDFDSADALWNSALGRALRLPVIPQLIEWDKVDESIVQDGEMLQQVGFEIQLAAALAADVIDDYDTWLYREIHAGVTIAELEDALETRTRFDSETINLAAYTEALTGRVLAWACKQLEGAAHHPDNDDEAADDTE